MQQTKYNIVKLGELIELCDERNSNGVYGEKDVRGISTDKKFIETKANLDGVSLNSYKVVKPREFVYVADTSRRGDKIALALNDSNSAYLISAIYTTFRCIDIDVLLPEYLFLLLSRTEFDRYSRFHSWGSARETFDWSEMCNMLIPLPSIEVQRELVGVYEGLKRLAEENEAMLDPLAHACEAFIINCKKNYDSEPLGKHIEECKEKNTTGIFGIDELKGVTSDSLFEETRANTNGLDLNKYKIVKPQEFAYNPARINLGSIALATQSCIISPMYIVFKVIRKDEIMPDYLQLWFSRKEFQRSTLFYAMGSVRDTFDYQLMCEVQIPIPPIDVQQKIVELYHCYEECKRIAAEAREQLKTICPALVQRGQKAI